MTSPDDARTIDPDRTFDPLTRASTVGVGTPTRHCRLYDLGEAGGHRFLTMEYIDGEDLSSSLRRFGRMPPDKAVPIARQRCAGVAAAHERGVLHRDLELANVMLDGNGDVRITDVGVATAAADAGADDVAGTPQ